MRKEDQEKWDRKLWVQLGHVKYGVPEEQSREKKSNKKVEIHIFDPSLLCVVDDALNEWHHQVWSMRCNKIIKNIAIKGLQLTIKGWAEKEEPSPEWRITEAKEDWFTEDNPNQRCQML